MPSDAALLAEAQDLDLPPLASTLGRPLRICMLAPCPFPTRQGTQVLIRHLATTLARAGHEVHLVTYGYGEYEDDFEFHLHRSAKVGSSLRSGPNLLKPAADAAMLVTAARVIKAYNCDLMHVHNAEGLGLGALLKLQTAIPMVYHAHNAMGPELPTYFRAHMAQAFASVVGDVIDRTLPKAADAVIAFDTDHLALHELYGVDAKRMHVIPPGLDSAEIRGADVGLTRQLRDDIGEGPWLLYSGNPDGYQNLPMLFSAYALVRETRPDAKLLLASNHEPESFEPALHGVKDRTGITVRQYSSIEELRAVFAVSDIGVCPRSLWSGAPIKLLNYLAAGLPSVACRDSGRHILQGPNGRLADATSESFAKAMLELLNAEPRARDRRRAFQRFEIDEQLPLYEAVYLQVLQQAAAVR